MSECLVHSLSTCLWGHRYKSKCRNKVLYSGLFQLIFVFSVQNSQTVMSADSSSDEDVHLVSKCWECGQNIHNLKKLISHYKSHNTKATCHICKVSFRRLTSLSTHLDNAHLPPVCNKCHQSFSNVWELNKHAEKHCTDSEFIQEDSSLICKRQSSDSSPNEKTMQQNADTVQHDSLPALRSEQRADIKPEMPKNSVAYILGADDEDLSTESDSDMAEDSTSSASEDEVMTHSKPNKLPPDHSETNGRSNSSFPNDSGHFSDCPDSQTTCAPFPAANSVMCTVCGRGPFKSIKLHLLHCSGVRVKYQCFLCKKAFLTESAVKKHHLALYACDICGQVFSHKNLYYSHQCPKGRKSPLVLFCSESMPKACNICKFLFTSEKYLVEHVTKVHTSVVSTKACTVTTPSLLAKDNRGAQSTKIQLQSTKFVSKAINGTHSDGQMSGTNGALAQPNQLPSSNLHSPFPVLSRPRDTYQEGALFNPPSQPMPTILAMFENDSHRLALMKRMNSSWRSKAPYPCRQCGAVLRQPSLIISHRYLHRGHRSHKCPCGRAFKHRLHLLRHCIQHAEAISYICVSCGDTFTGAKLLAQHLKGGSPKKPPSGCTWKRKVKRTCRMPFTCDCGELFPRPSAYIWHQLKNRTSNKPKKPTV